MRAGAIGLGDPGYSEKLAQQCHERAVAQIRRTVPDLVDVGLQCDERFSNDAVVRLVKEHADKPLDALFLVQTSWGRPAIPLQVIRAPPHLPMVLYSPGGEVIDGVIRTIASVTGAASNLPALRANGIKFKHVWSAAGEPIEEAAYLPFLARRRPLGSFAEPNSAWSALATCGSRQWRSTSRNSTGPSESRWTRSTCSSCKRK